MTTIKLIPGEIEFNVSIDSASMPSLFNQSMETTINNEVTRQIADRVPTNSVLVGQVAEYMQDDRQFARKITSWLLEEMDTREIARLMSEDFDFSYITEHLGLDGDEFLTNNNFLRAITDYSRFRSVVTNAVSDLYEAHGIESLIQNKIDTLITNMANEVTDKVMVQISNRLLSRTDV